eukprot:scaffold25556_cov70-Phaeocystis_antarctica.AAC.4
MLSAQWGCNGIARQRGQRSSSSRHLRAGSRQRSSPIPATVQAGRNVTARTLRGRSERSDGRPWPHGSAQFAC